MIPPNSTLVFVVDTAPRTRGDDPEMLDNLLKGIDLLPAPAGMIPARAPRQRRPDPAPRTRGDDPADHAELWQLLACSPHPRG